MHFKRQSLSTQRNLIFLFLCLCLSLASSCSLKGVGNSGNPKTPPDGTGNKGPNVPVALVLFGSQIINAGECQQYTATSVNIEGQPTPVTQDLSVLLSGAGGGNFYGEDSCSHSLSTIQLKSNLSVRSFYFKTHIAASITLTANGSPILPTSGSITISVLPLTDLAISESPLYDFGPRYLGTTTDKVFTVSNTGKSAATQLMAGTPALSAPYSFKGGSFPGTGGTCTSNLEPDGGSCTLILSYNPTALGIQSASLVLSYSDTVTTHAMSRSLRGTGVDSGGLIFQTTTPMDLADDRAFGMSIQTDGKLVVAGYSNRIGTGNDFSVARYLNGGTLDPTFGSSGKSYAAIGSGDDRALATAIQSDGKILIGGYAFLSGVYKFALVRFLTNGTLDNSFGTGGIATTTIGSGNAFAFALAIQSDGKILLAGYSQQGGGNQVSLTRYSTTGVLDVSFGSSGIVVTTVGSGSSYATAMGIQSNGKILVSGYASSLTTDFAAIRYNADGTLDSSFGSSGQALIDFNNDTDYSYAIAIQSDGKILIGGKSHSGGNYHFALLRLTAGGVLDSTFNGNGKLSTSVSANYDEIHSLSLQSDGKIIAAGFAYDGSNNNFALLRCGSEGILDPSFGGSGYVTVSFGSLTSSRAYASGIDSSGRIFTAGDTKASADNDFALSSFLP